MREKIYLSFKAMTIHGIHFFYLLSQFQRNRKDIQKVSKIRKKGVTGNSLFDYKNLRDHKKKRKKIVSRSIYGEKSEFMVVLF